MALFIETDRGNGKPPTTRRWWGLDFYASYRGDAFRVVKIDGDTVEVQHEYSEPRRYSREEINPREFSSRNGSWYGDRIITRRIVWKPAVPRRSLRATK